MISLVPLSKLGQINYFVVTNRWEVMGQINQAYDHVKTLVEKSQVIIITTHIDPDADGIGSQIALCLLLQSMGKQVTCLNEKPLSERYRYLDPQGLIGCYRDYDDEASVDLFIAVDTHDASRIGEGVEKILKKAKTILFIDHHPCPPTLTNLHCIDASAAATGQIVGELAEHLGCQINSQMALALYTAIVVDTSCFRYPTVSAKTHRLIAKLLEVGVKPARAYTMIYGAKEISHMQLLGKVLSHAQVDATQKIAWISLSDDMIKKHGADIEDTHSFINQLLILDQVKVACMFRSEGHCVKISMRSAKNIDVSLIAQTIGGGGHHHSAATIVKGEVAEVIPRIVDQIAKCLKENP